MPKNVSSVYIVWKKYQRRAEVLAPWLDADILFVPHFFRSKYLRPLDYLYKLAVTIAYIAHTRPDYAVVQAPPQHAALSALLTGVPYIVDAHNGVFLPPWDHLPLSRFLMRKSRGIIVHNLEILEIVRHDFPEATFFHIPDPLETIEANGIPRHEKQITFICSFGGDEPVDSIVGAIEALPEYDFVITADTAKLPRNKRLRLQQCSNLQLTGFLDTEDYHRLLCSSAAVVALTTLEATQQSAACEALSSDTPLIATRSSLSEKLFGDWAILVNNTADAIVQGIRSLEHKPLDLSAYRSSWNERVSQGVGKLRRALRKNSQQRRCR